MQRDRDIQEGNRAKEKDLLNQFEGLGLGEIMALPASLINPSTGDQQYRGHTAGPIEVYLLERKNGGEPTVWIQDGNCRFYNKLGLARIEANVNGTSFDPTKVYFQVRKVNPEREHDIRETLKAREFK